MKRFVCTTVLLTVLFVQAVMSVRHIAQQNLDRGHRHQALPSIVVSPSIYSAERELKKQQRADTLQIAGSRLPDCTHACGSCSPCRLVMVRYVCSSLAEAETCPLAYRCMCKNKSYPVP